MFQRSIHIEYIMFAVIASGVLAACDSSSSTTATPTIAQGSTPASLPFSFQFPGSGSSPPFHIDAGGSYTVHYVLTGGPPPTPPQPGCNIFMVGPNGSELVVEHGVQLQPNGTKQASQALTLTTGDWRFEEGGGCSWSVTVNLGG